MSREVDSGDADSARLSECIFVAIAKAAQQRRTPYRSCRSVNCGDATVRVRRQSQGRYAEARWPGARRFSEPRNEKGEMCSRTLARIKYSTLQESEVEAGVSGGGCKSTRHRRERFTTEGTEFTETEHHGYGMRVPGERNRTAVRMRAAMRTRPARTTCHNSFLCGVAQTFYDVER